MTTAEPKDSAATSGSSSGAPEGRARLNREAIVAAGIVLADRSGERGLTMRRLAESLGYEVMSLYNHVANKAQLLDLMIDAVADEIVEPDDDLPPLEAIRALAIASRATLVDHPWAAGLWLRQLPGPVRVRQMELLLQLLDVSGLSEDLAHHGFHAVNNHIIGYTLQEQGMLDGLAAPADAIERFLESLSPDQHPRMIHHVDQHQQGDTGSSFELVLDFILDGLQRLNETGGEPT